MHSSWVTAFLTRFCHICLELEHPVFTSLIVATVSFFFYRVRLSVLRPTPKPRWPGPLFMFPRNKVTQLNPQAPGALLRLSELRWRYSNPPPRRSLWTNIRCSLRVHIQQADTPQNGSLSRVVRLKCVRELGAVSPRWKKKFSRKMHEPVSTWARTLLNR
jgi:hypothetical protein